MFEGVIETFVAFWDGGAWMGTRGTSGVEGEIFQIARPLSDPGPSMRRMIAMAVIVVSLVRYVVPNPANLACDFVRRAGPF